MTAVALPQDLYAVVRAFVRTVAGGCGSCLRRNMGYCDSCTARAAAALGRRMDEATAADRPPEPPHELSLVERFDCVLAQIRRADRPLASAEIDLRAHCSKEMKAWTLRMMVLRGLLVRRVCGGGRYEYSVNESRFLKKRKETQNER